MAGVRNAAAAPDDTRQAGVADLEDYAADSDLVIVAAGKGEIATLFERDAREIAVRHSRSARWR